VTPDRWRHLEALFIELSTLPPAERQAQLGALEDRETAAELERLLAADDAAGSFLESSIAAGARETLARSDRGRRIGPYRLVEELGQGGMGIVYLAERADDQFQQRVALKLLHRGFETRDRVARFRAERQILARLEHPAIARLLDGGTTEDGRPYYGMELVPGQPIDADCDARRRTIRERLELFLEVLEAVRYAHQNLVVHRDIKPSNVLVTPEGRPKLLDFGVAKILEAESSEGTDLTGLGGRPMTLAYASPEQVKGEPVTTGSDVYALGVLLYLLLTGRRPYPSEGRSGSEVERLILEHQPERPSRAVRAAGDPVAAQNRGLASAVALARRLEGDLDNIVLTTLAKEPAERYPSVERLSDDLRRHLAGLPILARPTPWHRRAAKFVGRHRVGVAASLTIGLLGLGLVIGSVAFSRRAARESARDHAVSRLLIDVFEIADPSQTKSNEVTGRELLDLGAERVRREFSAKPELQSEMFASLGQAFLNLGLPGRAAELHSEAVKAGRRARLDDGAMIHRLLDFGRALGEGGRYLEAAEVFREAVERAERALPEDALNRAFALGSYGLIQHDLGHYAEADELYRRAITVFRAAGSPGRTTRGNRALLLIDFGRYDEAIAVYRELLAEAGGEPLAAANALEFLSMALLGGGQLTEAETTARRSLELRETHLRPNDPDIARSRNALGAAQRERGDLAAAEPLLQRALEERRRILGPDHGVVAVTWEDLGDLQLAARRFAEAREAFAEAQRISRLSYPPSHPTIARIAAGTALTHVVETACRAGREELETALSAVPPADFRAVRAREVLAECR
jgi:eukaryotic-like serine/threonine-protein kinase